MKPMPYYAERIQRGMAYLDRVNPGWIYKVDVMRLKLSNCTKCVLGQLYGNYRTYVKQLGYKTDGTWAKRHGFYPRDDTEWVALTWQWQYVISERLRAATHNTKEEQ